MGYSGDPQSTPRDMVRFLMGDTGTPEMMNDSEVDALLAINSGNVWAAAADGCDTIVAKLSPTALSKSIGGWSLQTQQKVDHYTALAMTLRNKVQRRQMGSPTWTGSRLPAGTQAGERAPLFDIGQFDAPSGEPSSAGQSGF